MNNTGTPGIIEVLRLNDVELLKDLRIKFETSRDEAIEFINQINQAIKEKEDYEKCNN